MRLKKCFCILIANVLCLWMLVAQCPNTILVDPGFEEAHPNWLGGTVIHDSTNAYSGEAYRKICAFAPMSVMNTFSQTFFLTGGNTYTLTCYAQLEDSAAISFFRVDYFNDQNAQVGGEIDVRVTSLTWEQYTKTLNPPLTATQARLTFAVGPVLSQFCLNVDDVCVTSEVSDVFTPADNGQSGIRYTSLIPNPVSEWLQISLYASESQEIAMSVYNTQGLPVFASNFEATPGSNTYPLCTSNWKSGIYSIVIQGKKRMICKQFFKSE